MGNINVYFDSEKDLTSFTVIGEVGVEEVRNMIQNFYDGTITKNVIWDLSESNLANLTSSEIYSIAHTPRKYAHKRAGGKTAIVAPSDITFGLTRMYELMTELQNLPFKTQPFKKLEEAHKWLVEIE